MAEHEVAQSDTVDGYAAELSGERLRAVRASLVYFFGAGAERGIALLMLPILTAYLPVADFGFYALLFLTATIANYFVSTPLTTALSRFYHAPEYVDARGLLLRSLLILVLVKASLCAGLYLLVAPIITDWLEVAPKYQTAILWYAGVLWMMPLPAVPLLYLQLVQRAKVATACSLGGVVVGTIATIGLLVQGWGMHALIAGQAIQLFVSCLLTWPPALIAARGQASWQVLGEPLRWGYSLLPASYSSLVIDMVDRYLITLFLGIGSTGVYELGYRLSTAISVVLIQPVKKGLHPVCFKLEKDREAQRKLIQDFAIYFYIIATWLALGFSLYARDIVRLVAQDESYWPAWTIVPLITFAYVQNGVGQFLNYGIIMAKRSFCNSAILMVSAGVNIVLNIALIPWLGLIGAAIATAVCYLVWNGLKVHYSKKYYDLTFDVRRMILISVLAISLTVGGVAFAELLPVGFIGALAANLILFAVFPCLLAVTGLILPSERRFVATSLHRALVVGVQRLIPRRWHAPKSEVPQGGRHV